jgi:hypothetical protein
MIGRGLPSKHTLAEIEVRSVTMEAQNAGSSSAASQAELVGQVERVSTARVLRNQY